jgi:hypothetical protein
MEQVEEKTRAIKSQNREKMAEVTKRWKEAKKAEEEVEKTKEYQEKERKLYDQFIEQVVLENWKDKVISAQEKGCEFAILYNGKYFDRNRSRQYDTCFKTIWVKNLKKDLPELVKPFQVKVSGESGGGFLEYSDYITVKISWGNAVQKPYCTVQ